MTTLNKDALAKKYIELRDEAAAMAAEAAARVAPLKANMEKIELYFKALATQEGVESWKTAHGTVYLSRIESVRLADAGAFFDYVVANEALDFIEKRASKTGVVGFLQANAALPPGAEMSARVEVNIRRPAAS